MKKLFLSCFLILFSILFTQLRTYAQVGTIVAGTGRPGSGADQLNSVWGIAFDAAANLYISDRYNNRLMKYAPGAMSGVAITGFNSGPTDVFVDKAGFVYATDDLNRRILKFAPGSVGNPQVIIQATAGNNFLSSDGISVDDAGNVYFIDNANTRLLKYAPGATAPSFVINVGKSISDVFLDAAGNIYLSEDADNAVVKFATASTEGVVVAGGNGRGFGANQFANPSGLFVDNVGNLYVCDESNARVQKWAPGATEGVTVAGGNGAGNAANQLVAPHSVLLDKSGFLFVADYNGFCVKRYDPTGLSFKYYEGSWSSLPDFSSLQPVKTGLSAGTDISVRTPGRDDNFAFVWEGYIKLPAAGNYTFETVSDDGSRFYFNSLYSPTAIPTINNDGLHAPISATGTVYAPAAGTYPISITYFEKDGGEQMQLYWSGPGIERQLIPSAALTSVPPTTAPPTSPASLSYKYYEGGFTTLPDFNSLTPVKTGSSANFDLSIRTPGVNDSFAIVWEGFINIPTAGTYTFETNSDDGSKFYFDGQTVVDNDGLHPPKLATASVTVPAAGRYPIKVAYFEAYGDESFQVFWSGPGIARQQIPDPAFADNSNNPPAKGLNYKYYEGDYNVLPDFNTLTPVRTGISANADPSLKNADVNVHFAFMWQGYITLPTAGTYTFETRSDDGSKIYFNAPYSASETGLVNNDGLHAAVSATGVVSVPAAGSYPITITFFQKESGYFLQLFWTGPNFGKQLIPDAAFSTGSTTTPPPTTAVGLGYKYYEGDFDVLPNFNLLTPVKISSNENVNISERTQYHDDSFAFLWQGYINIPTPGNFTFETLSDDGSKLYFNQFYDPSAIATVNNDGLHQALSATGTVNVAAAGWYPITVSYFEKNGAEQMEVYWSGPGIARQRIPSSYFAQVAPSAQATASMDSRLPIGTITENGESIARIYPNPFRESFNIEFYNSAAANDIEITVYDLKGVMIYRKKEGKIAPGNIALKVNLAGNTLAPGIYMARLQVNGVPTKTVKLLKTK